MNRWMKYLTVAGSLALATGRALAQTPSTPYAVEVEANVRAVYPQQQAIELEDGTWLSAASGEQLAGIQPGVKVKVLCIDAAGRKQIESIQTATD